MKTKKLLDKTKKKVYINNRVKKGDEFIMNNEYVNNNDFMNLLRLFKKTEDRKIFNKLGKIFLEIATRISKLPNFINYSHDRKSEMISDATFFMVKYIHTYDLKRDNPFAWFSQIAFNAFKQNINKNNKKDDIFISLSYVENLSENEVSNNQ